MAMKIKVHESNKKQTWWRLGVNVELTDDELEKLNNGESGLLYAKIMNGDFAMSGETYMPESGNEGIIEKEICLEY